MIWRNDDVSHATSLQQFTAVHELFKKYNVLHTVAMICKDIGKNKELVKYINANNIDVQVHALEHTDFTLLTDEQINTQFNFCVGLIQKYFKRKPTVFYPPWNRSNNLVAHVAYKHGLTVSNTKISLSQYLSGKHGEVINFHSWSDECKDLEAALIKYTS